MIAGGRVVTPGGVLDPGWVRVRRGVIDAVGSMGRTSGPPEVGRARDGGEVELDITGSWLVPGFVDIHCHGGGGAMYADGSVAEALVAADTHRRHGTTTTLASLLSRPIPELIEQVSGLAELVADGVLAGVHLEGPFISTARRGAHDPAPLCPPDPTVVAKLLRAGKGAIRMVTLAPELVGAREAIRRFTDAGVVVAVGHTDATEAEVRLALDAGATVATHLFNGMRPLHHREPGPVGALLDDERVTVELICDLVHVHPTVVRVAARHAGTARTVLVTDAMAAAGAGDGDYQVGKRRVTVRDGVPTLDDGGPLAGSSLTMDAAIRNFVQGCGMSLPEAVAATASRPAALLGVAGKVGVIVPGAVANLVVLDAGLRVTHVLHRGISVVGA